MKASSNSFHISLLSLSANQFESQVDAQFRQFADNLRAFQDYHDKGIRLCENVRKKLEWAVQNETFSIESTYYGGSMTKATDLQGSDFDIVMKINNRKPPFVDVLQFFNWTLSKYCAELEIDHKSIKVTKGSVQFSFLNEMKVDLLPATSDLTPQQVLQKVKLDPINRQYYCSSLVVRQVEFMKEQDAFAHALARLAKHWYKSMRFPNHVNGGSVIFELLGVAAALEQNSWRKESMSLGFIRIVEMIENLDELKIGFERSNGAWRLESTNRLHFNPPFLLEPANCGNNFMDGIYLDEFKLFWRNGKVMRERLRNLMENRQYCGKGDGEEGSYFKINFKKLFKAPQG